ncbi:hypothetical protein [Prevotella sp.]|uniref:hypothetical protein n=1 Tax=Prevotella sp. TaxID=59823 RepID=UPI0027E2ECA1|nr:hypothetical protein [Prevotella sp.]
MAFREQALNTHTSYLLLVQQLHFAHNRAINIKNIRLQLPVGGTVYQMFLVHPIFGVIQAGGYRGGWRLDVRIMDV